jgi:hypothetical protein
MIAVTPDGKTAYVTSYNTRAAKPPRDGDHWTARHEPYRH